MDAQVQAGQSRQMGYQVAPGYELSLVERIFCELVEIDSPSFHEHEMAAEVRRRLEGLGFNVVEDATSGKNDGMVTSITSTRRFGRLMDNASDLVRLVHTGSDCGNLFATLPGVGEPVLFITHMDTVQPAFSKHAKVHANGMITSLGDTVLGADDLAGIACVMAAVDHLQQAGIPHRPVELACMVAEEVGNVGARAFDFSQSKAPVAFTLDYSADPNEYAYQAPTILYLTIEVIGRSAHAGFYPERGVNAIKIAAHAIDQVQCGRIGDDTTCNMGIISGGRGTNIVPSDVVIRGEVRSYDHAKAVHQTQVVREIFQRAAQELGGEVTPTAQQGDVVPAAQTAGAQPVEGDPVPLLQIFCFPAHQLQLFPWIVDQRSQLTPLRLGQAGEEQLVHLFFYHAGAGVEDVQEGLILPVDVRDEMLRSLGQVQNGLEVDDLRAGGLDGGILAGQHVQIT